MESFTVPNYSRSATILLFGLSKQEESIISDAIKNMTVYDKNRKKKFAVNYYMTDLYTDIVAVPYAVALINFLKMSEDEKDDILEFFLEYEGSLSDELINMGFIDEDFVAPIVYPLNLEIADRQLPKSFQVKANLFNDTAVLRLNLLSIFKDQEGLGTASTNSIRLYRVLQMYKILKDIGQLTKEDVDAFLYPDGLSESMFYRDVSVIREIEEGNLIYDRKTKVYRLKKY